MGVYIKCPLCGEELNHDDEAYHLNKEGGDSNILECRKCDWVGVVRLEVEFKDLGAYTEEEAWEKARTIDNDCVMMYRSNEMLGAPEDTWGFESNSSAIQVKRWYKANYEKCKILEK